MNEEFSEKQKHDIDHRKSHDDKAQNQREHIINFIVFLDIVFVLQRESAEIM